ncbi:MAG: SRPBCC family protein, partial [Aeromonas sp.]
MPRITRSALVMFSAEQMFKLVNDVDAYPQFLPGCVGSRIHEMGDNYMTASVDVAKAGIAKTFTTRNQLDENRQIKMELVDGPFRTLIGWWTFTPLDVDACKVEFDLNFEFTSKLIELAFG